MTTLCNTTEKSFSNGMHGSVSMTICVPTFKQVPNAMIDMLAKMKGAHDCALLIFDDGSADGTLTAQIEQSLLKYPGPAQLITALQNAGRSHARNRLEQAAHTNWILFLDADMLPDNMSPETRSDRMHCVPP